MPEPVKEKMETGFGADFSDVRIHPSSGSAVELGALAYTQGSDIHFQPGRYQPDTSAGQEMLGHELAHVAQQEKGGAATPMAFTGPGYEFVYGGKPSLEAEADVVASRVVKGEKVDSSAISPAPLSVQCFGGMHRNIGDTAAKEDKIGSESGVLLARAETVCTTRRDYDCYDLPGQRMKCDVEETKTCQGPKEYRLSPGEVSYAADYFSSYSEMRAKALMYLVRNQDKTSSDEIWYVIQAKLKGKPEGDFDKSTRDAVQARYLKLASENFAHFSKPSDDPKNEKLSNGATYRENHENAIRMAVGAGKAERTIDEALGLEAFGSHFLQDMFPAGHIRTARYDAQALWDAKYPAFFDQLKSWLNEELWEAGGADAVQKGLHEKAWYFGSLVGYAGGDWGRRKIFNWKFKKSMKKIPTFTLGSIIGCAMHDYDNEAGVLAVSPLGPEGEQPFTYRAAGEGTRNSGTFNDDYGKEREATKKLAIAATKAGRGDIAAAYSRGKSGESADAVMAALKASGPAADGSTYKAERYKPVEIEMCGPNKEYDWKTADINSLQYDTEVGKAIAFSVRTVILANLSSVAETMPDMAPLLGPVKNKLNSRPLETLKEIATHGWSGLPVIARGVAPTKPEKPPPEYEPGDDMDAGETMDADELGG